MKKLLDKLATLLIVTVVTLLVWLYAEDANIEEHNDEPVRLAFIVPEGEEGRLTPSGPITVQVDFDGSTGQYQQFADMTREEVIELALPLALSEDYESLDISMRQLLSDDVFRDLGINIEDVRPAVVTVSFEKNIDVPLGLPTIEAPGLELAEPAEVTNAQPIVVRGLPAGRRDELKDIVPIVLIRPEDVEALPKGEQRQIRLPVRLSKDVEGITPTPATVDVLVRIANDIDRVTIDRRAIQLTYPPSINQRYVLEIDESARFITAFELEGPRDQIAQIKADPSSPSVYASVRLTNEEVDKAAAEGGELSKAVDIIAPPGVVPVSVAQRVTIRVTPRPAPGTP